jgi:phosphoribosylaminoimidazole-succinocarboxamide synthase
LKTPSPVAVDERAQVAGRSMLLRRLAPLPCEAVVRGYVAGSGWKEYASSGTECGIALPPGLSMTTPLAEPIFTPATKAAVGDQDENISFAQLEALIGAPRGIVIADTKFEFGLDADGRLTLMYEVLTPDSSRFWLADELAQGRIVALDKQPLRDWLAQTIPQEIKALERDWLVPMHCSGEVFIALASRKWATRWCVRPPARGSRSGQPDARAPAARSAQDGQTTSSHGRERRMAPLITPTIE